VSVGDIRQEFVTSPSYLDVFPLSILHNGYRVIAVAIYSFIMQRCSLYGVLSPFHLQSIARCAYALYLSPFLLNDATKVEMRLLAC
jgi:hypothetical protein